MSSVPNLFDKWTSGIVLLDLHSFIEQKGFYFECCPKGGNDNNVLRMDVFPGDELATISIHDKSYPTTLEVVVYLLIVDHLAEQVNFPGGILLKSPVTNFDSVFHAVAKTEMAGQIKYDRTKIENGGSKILLAQVPQPAKLLYPAG
jgi:hypothetical protein